MSIRYCASCSCEKAEQDYEAINPNRVVCKCSLLL